MSTWAQIKNWMDRPVGWDVKRGFALLKKDGTFLAVNPAGKAVDVATAEEAMAHAGPGSTVTTLENAVGIAAMYRAGAFDKKEKRSALHLALYEARKQAGLNTGEES